jgi:hypothetical protein
MERDFDYYKAFRQMKEFNFSPLQQASSPYGHSVVDAELCSQDTGWDS